MSYGSRILCELASSTIIAPLSVSFYCVSIWLAGSALNERERKRETQQIVGYSTYNGEMATDEDVIEDLASLYFFAVAVVKINVRICRFRNFFGTRVLITNS